MLIAAQCLGMCGWQLGWTLASFPEGFQVPWLLGAAGRHSMGRFCLLLNGCKRGGMPWKQRHWHSCVLSSWRWALLKKFSTLGISGAIWIKIGFLLAGKVWALWFLELWCLRNEVKRKGGVLSLILDRCSGVDVVRSTGALGKAVKGHF